MGTGMSIRLITWCGATRPHNFHKNPLHMLAQQQSPSVTLQTTPHDGAAQRTHREAVLLSVFPQEETYQGLQVAGQVKVIAAKPDNLGQIPGPAWWKERNYSCKLSSDLIFTVAYTCTLAYIHAYVCTYTQIVSSLDHWHYSLLSILYLK